MTTQLSLPIRIHVRSKILGVFILKTYHKTIQGIPTLVEVVGGRFEGDGFVSILRLDRNISRVQYYCGSTNDPDRRMQEHRRTWPTSRLTGQDLAQLVEYGFRYVSALWSLEGRTFHRKHTFLHAVRRCLGDIDQTSSFLLLNAARKHTSNGIIMAANHRGIGWHIARIFQANRSLEDAIKRQKKNLATFLPAHGEMPF